MTFALLIVAFVGLEVYYGLLSDAAQSALFADVQQWEAVALGCLAFVSTPYEKTGRKIVVLVLVLYLGWVAATDWAITWFPPWGGLIEAGLFAVFAFYAVRKIHAVSGDE